jgi:ABC-2 type transport system ATP-binding protein
MSVVVDSLVKIYGSQRALDGVSFQVAQGEILGFLGPNGAGKSTTMKILTQYIQADEGEAYVAGHKVDGENLEAKKLIGYLPEHNSLYKDMYVREYLSFIAGLHGINKKRQKVEEIIERTGLGLEAHKQIGMLSKGYRQRVGLAQAMIHDPHVLILDEPTSGLDPNQLREIRKLIKDLGEEKTVIFSSHIMQEVQALCDRVVIIDRGRIIADKSIEELSQLTENETCVTLKLKQEISRDALTGIAGVSRIEQDGRTYRIYYRNDKDLREDIFNHVVQEKGVIMEMGRTSASIEDVFQKLTTS